MTRRLAVLMSIAVLLLVGCGDGDTEQGQKDKVCEEVAELDASVAQLAALEPTAANVPRVRELRSLMESQYGDVQDAAEDASGITIEPVTQAYNTVLRSIQGVNDQATLAQAESGIDDAAGQLSNARLELHTNARCA
ncbi:MAG: hypothetical protein M3314_06620 [Actinomycetota bacterium]|nr:hypothetical protein [Actinomycetota bacterium]